MGDEVGADYNTYDMEHMNYNNSLVQSPEYPEYENEVLTPK